jgi:hypothetical protein
MVISQTEAQVLFTCDKTIPSYYVLSDKGFYNISWYYGMTLLGDPTINFRHQVSDVCVENLTLTAFPSDDHSNLVLYRAGSSIYISDNFVIPSGVHVIFDAPIVTFANGFSCPLGASFETRKEGCEL